MEKPKRIIIAVTGASGAIYARQALEALGREESLEEIAVIVSRNGREVAAYENETLPEAGSRIVYYDNDDMFSPPASGSAGYDAMAVIPCSMGSAGRIASGVSLDLIGRAAEVMLKERRRLVLVVRETPLSTIHLKNLTTLSECGAVVLPASPSFYSHAAGIEELCSTVTDRLLSLLGFGNPGFRWGDNLIKN